MNRRNFLKGVFANIGCAALAGGAAKLAFNTDQDAHPSDVTFSEKNKDDPYTSIWLQNRYGIDDRQTADKLLKLRNSELNYAKAMNKGNIVGAGVASSAIITPPVYKFMQQWLSIEKAEPIETKIIVPFTFVSAITTSAGASASISRQLDDKNKTLICNDAQKLQEQFKLEEWQAKRFAKDFDTDMNVYALSLGLKTSTIATIASVLHEDRKLQNEPSNG